MERTTSVCSDRNIWNHQVHFDRSGHFGRSDRNVPFHLTKLLSPVPLFCNLLTRTYNQTRGGLSRVCATECTVPLGAWNFRNFKPEFLLNGKRPRSRASDRSGCNASKSFSQRGRRQTGGKGRENEGRISRSHSLYTDAIFFSQILHHEE